MYVIHVVRMILFIPEVKCLSIMYFPWSPGIRKEEWNNNTVHLNIFNNIYSKLKL